MKYRLIQLNENLVTHSGLSIVGQMLAKTSLKKRLDRSAIPQVADPTILHSEVVKSYVGLLCQGKSDFDHIEPFREDIFFGQSLRVKKVPSSPTMRQRFNLAGNRWREIVLEESAGMLKTLDAVITPCIRDLVPLDIDVTPFDNSNTKKEGVKRTYKGHDGYAPIFAYLGQEGYGVNVELREGSEHSQHGTPEFLKQTLRYARMITDQPLLIRMDAGFDSVDNLKVCLNTETPTDLIIKRNLRREGKESWLNIAEQKGICCLERDGKKVYYGELETKVNGVDRPVRMIYRIVERTITASGQYLVIPDIEVETYWTTLPDPPSVVINLYHDHGTSEQFHSEIKGELDLERLPSGKFDTNHIVLTMGLLAYNILRFIGQASLNTQAPLRKKVQRRRIRTVIQNIITIAARLISHSRRWTLGFGRHSPWFPAFKHIYEAIS